MEDPALVQIEENPPEGKLSDKNIAVQAFWDYITKVANGEKLNRMILWQLVENYPQNQYDFNGRAIDIDNDNENVDFQSPDDDKLNML